MSPIQLAALLERRIRFTLLLACIALTGCATSPAGRFQSHIDYLASDRLEGRGVGTRGIEEAAEYIAEQFARLGLAPAGEENSYFQTLAMTLRRTLGDDSRLTLEGTVSAPVLGEDYIPLGFSSDGAFSGAVAFCGYGIDAPTKGYSDFAHFDVEGKVALVLRGEPPSWAEDDVPTHHAMLRNKVYNAKDRGAAAILLVNSTGHEGESDSLIPFDSDSPDEYGIPAFQITRALANEQLVRAGLPGLTELEERLNAGSFASTMLANITAAGQAVFSTQRAETHNVVGLLQAEGSLADEYIVIGAHYDHLGVRRPMSRRFEKGKLVAETTEPQIHNGADDNASGVSGLIEAARLLSQVPRPERSVLFVAFTAEESGLHGSKHFVDHSPVPLEKIVGMLNMDMIGRMPERANSVQVFGVDSAKEFRAILESRASGLGLAVAPSPDTGGRSDHAPFIRNGVPAMHFFTGQHPDYHQPSDDAEKINAADGVRVATLVAYAARDIAAGAARPTFQQVQTRAPGDGQAPTAYRVVMGLSPGYGDDGKPGMAVEAVSPDGPAELGGIKAGDRIIRIGDKQVANIYDYMAALRNNKPDDVVTTIVLRDGIELTLTVTLSAAR
jgi:Zn-dependent M28 family amino/carboxypeptidase